MKQAHDTKTLLTAWTRRGCEASFRELVTHYSGLVYGTAMRATGGRADLAPDIAQRVFVDLARKAARLAHDERLGLWLHKRARWAAADALRSERRRQTRETIVAMEKSLTDTDTPPWDEWAPELDEALGRLPKRDRQAIVLRFLEGRRLAAVGEAIGVSEEAARKRVTRALDKLRGALSRRGVALSATGLLAAMGAESAKAAPAGSGAAWAKASVAGKATGLAAVCGRALVPASSVALGAALSAAIILPVSAVRQHDRQDAAIHSPASQDGSEALGASAQKSEGVGIETDPPLLGMDAFVRALASLHELPPGPLRESRQRHLLERVRPDLGLELGDAILASVPHVRVDDLTEGIVGYWLDGNTVSAREIFEFLVDRWPSGSAHNSQLGWVAGMWPKYEPYDALTWLEGAERDGSLRRASGNPDFRKVRNSLVKGIANGIARQEGSKAEAEFIVDAVNRGWIVDDRFVVFLNDKAEAFSILAGIRSPVLRTQARRNILRSIEFDQPGAGQAMVASVASREERMALAFRLAHGTFDRQDPPDRRYNGGDWAPLLDWATAGSLPSRRPYETASLFKDWIRRGDLLQAAAWLKEHPDTAADPHFRESSNIALRSRKAKPTPGEVAALADAGLEITEGGRQ